MIYVRQDFYSNFNAAVQANDDPTIQGIVVDELSNLIAHSRTDVVNLFQKVGIPLSAKPTNEELAKSIVINLKANKKLQAGLAYLIAKDNDILASAEKSNRDSDEKQSASQKREIDYERSADTVTSIAGTINILANTLQGDRATKFQTDLIDKTNTKAPNYSAQAYSDKTVAAPVKKKSKKWLWWLLAAAVVSGGIYLAHKKGWIGKPATPAPMPGAAPAATNVVQAAPTVAVGGAVSATPTAAPVAIATPAPVVTPVAQAA